MLDVKLFSIHALNTTQVCDYTVKQDRGTLSVTEQAEINRCEHRTATNADTVTLQYTEVNQTETNTHSIVFKVFGELVIFILWKGLDVLLLHTHGKQGLETEEEHGWSQFGVRVEFYFYSTKSQQQSTRSILKREGGWKGKDPTAATQPRGSKHFVTLGRKNHQPLWLVRGCLSCNHIQRGVSFGVGYLPNSTLIPHHNQHSLKMCQIAVYVLSVLLSVVC